MGGVVDGGLKALVARSRLEAQRRRQRCSTAHLLLTLFQGCAETGPLLSRCGLREGDLLSALKVVTEESTRSLDVAIENAQKLAARLEQPAGPLHLLYILCRDGRTAAHRCLEHVGIGARPVLAEVTGRLGVSDEPRRASAPPPPAVGATPARPLKRPGSRRPLLPRARRGRGPVAPPSPTPPSIPAPEPAPKNVRLEAPTPLPLPDHALDPDRFPLLSALGRNLTEEAVEGRIDPVVGRDAEVEQLLDVLARRRGNNPLLVGPPGVGKTAVVEALALRLAAGGPGVRGQEGRLLVELTAGSLVSGTGVRGALADRLRQIREEITEADGRVILFLDEVHAVLGGPEGPEDLATELKQFLSRGEISCIGATTEAEHKRHFERDPALARRFSAVRVDEPSAETALVILRGIAPRYEAHHTVGYTPGALEAAVELSIRFLPERRLPDKAISVIDLAAARVRRRGGDVVDRPAVAAVISEWAQVPVERLTMRDADRLLALETLLAERIVGHEAALRRIADTLRKGAAGFRGRRPLGTLLLLGPTGVGKTETARAVSELLFAGGAMTRFDMSELGEAHAVARLLGAPPGYVGHEDGGQLTEAVRRRPYQLVLLDEIDKAHPEVMLALLPLLDEGRLTDGRGRTVDFTNTVVFMTSNLGAAEAVGPGRIGFSAGDGDGALAARVAAAARRALPPELWNRIDEPIVFGPLGEGDVAEIARRMLDRLAARLDEEQGVRLVVEPSAIEALVRAGGYDAALGARPMRRVIGRLVEAPLASRIIGGELAEGDEVLLSGDGNRILFEGRQAAEAAE
jgi:ATP-dependent Clp protease ATP-binding subunit ClpC